MGDRMCHRSKCRRRATRPGQLCHQHYEISPHGLVDAQPTIDRYHLLRGCGLTVAAIAQLSGVNRDSLRIMCFPDRKSVRVETRDRLMAVRIPDRIVSSRTTLPAIGTHRRIQALAAIGHSLGFQAEQLGVTEQAVAALLRKQVVQASSVVKVTELYDRLEMLPGTSSRSRNHAARKGWLPPVWWDADTIDDPDVKPNPGERVRASAAERIAELQDDLGITNIHAIASRLGVKPGSIERTIDRSSAA